MTTPTTVINKAAVTLRTVHDNLKDNPGYYLSGPLTEMAQHVFEFWESADQRRFGDWEEPFHARIVEIAEAWEALKAREHKAECDRRAERRAEIYADMKALLAREGI